MAGPSISDLKKKGITYPFRCGYCTLKVNIKSEIIKQSFLFENTSLGISVVLHKKCKPSFLLEMKIVYCKDSNKIMATCDGKNLCYGCKVKRIKRGIFD